MTDLTDDASRESAKSTNPDADHSADRDYAVGYGKPPKHTRFKPGQSGNPKGRRKGSKNEATILQELLDGKKITLREGSKVTRITVREGILRRFTEEALKGDLKSGNFILNRRAQVDAQEAAHDTPTENDRELLDAYIRRQAKWARSQETSS